MKNVLPGAFPKKNDPLLKLKTANLQTTTCIYYTMVHPQKTNLSFKLNFADRYHRTVEQHHRRLWAEESLP